MLLEGNSSKSLMVSDSLIHSGSLTVLQGSFLNHRDHKEHEEEPFFSFVFFVIQAFLTHAKKE
ncbi:hypothetical protein GV64_11675 [Endozoicomonas elysicola]|uniref:Uncharacterized protein n=1 Tax=Endozoicomonas elysicola TaxID=305900 RepID=A0A081KAY2_9GAMM|nr:hypothetical protein GV64_11675 [Endozoicomonas elysicola]